MSIHLLQAVQQNLGIEQLKKIDPNTQEIKDTENSFLNDKLNQSAIPAVLIILYKYTRSNEGAEMVLHGNLSNNWIDFMLPENSKVAIDKISAYANTSSELVAEKMELIAKTCIGIIRESNPLTTKDVKDIFASQKNEILTHLPAALQMGDLLNDNTIDDRTNKMEGPVSSLMKMLSGQFSQSEKSKED